MEKLKAELEEVKKIDMKQFELEMKKMKEEIEKIGPQIKQEMEKAKIEMENAKVEIEKAKVELKEYKEFINGLEKDGLISKDNYTIEHKNGELFIDGKKQPGSVYNKYRKFLDGHKKFTMKKTADDFNISNDDDD